MLERRPRQPIRIETFGGLRLYRAGDRVPDSSFGRAKARALLGALVCAGPRGAAPRPAARAPVAGAAPERGDAGARHHAPRAAPHAGAAGPAALGRLARPREGEIYRLALGERDSWDAGEFLRSGPGRGGRPDEVALGRMLRAEALWRGDFLPDFPYEPWCEDTRRELERERIELLERLARTLAEMGRPGPRSSATAS